MLIAPMASSEKLVGSGTAAKFSRSDLPSPLTVTVGVKPAGVVPLNEILLVTSLPAVAPVMLPKVAKVYCGPDASAG